MRPTLQHTPTPPKEDKESASQRNRQIDHRIAALQSQLDQRISFHGATGTMIQDYRRWASFRGDRLRDHNQI